MMQTAERWDARSVTIVNLVDLGAGLAPEGETNRPTIVLPPREPALGPGRDDRAPSPFGPRPGELGQPGPPPTEPGTTNLAERGRPPRRDGPERSRFGRPFWMDEKQFQALLEKRGLHGLVLALPTDTFRRACTQDLWIRLVIGALASIAVGGLALAWRNLAKSSELEVRLVRASELNARLKEMNLAAAGLAHETKNPLNIIRGLAQMISKQQDAAPEVRGRSREIIDETDRVAAQLNEFINYSRPREVRRTAVALAAAVGEVVRAVGSDLEEKALRLQVAPDMPTIEADEQLLRQALFNLLINAIQAVPPQGEINIRAAKQSATEAYLEVCDNGPGVLPEHRTEIFKPYFTTQEKGTGLGLAVVQQIVLAHGWEIECLANEPQGAVFRITHLRLLP
jgi:signal transduction histidine kinase